MPPKKGGGGAKDAKAREKAVEDKTFGMKNKKGAKGQKFVQQVKQSMEANSGRSGNRGPSKKEMKEMQKAQEAEMLALFNAVPKKKDEQSQNQQELDPDAGPTFTDITQEIEYQRANVQAKTKITNEVFLAWRKKKLAARKQKEEEARRERQKKGLLTGREIFMDTKINVTDDETAAGDDDMLREVDDELEIAKMNALAAEERRRARVEAGLEAEEVESTPQDHGAASTSRKVDPGEATSSAAVVTASGLELSKDEAALLEEEEDDIDLDALEAQLENASLKS